VVKYNTKDPEDDRDDDKVRVADLIDETLLIRVGESGIVHTRQGDGFRVLADVWRIDLAAGELVPVGSMPFFQQVLVRVLKRHEPGEWLVRKLIQPGRAFLFESPDIEDEAAIDALVGTFEPDAKPKSPGSRRPRIEPDYGDDEPF
jgi:hypothetical protein